MIEEDWGGFTLSILLASAGYAATYALHPERKLATCRLPEAPVMCAAMMMLDDGSRHGIEGGRFPPHPVSFEQRSIAEALGPPPAPYL